MRHSIERDAATNYVRIATHPFLPKILRDECDICALLFLGKKIPAKNWTYAKHVKVVGSQSSTEDLHGITETSQCEGKEILPGQTLANGLAIAKMFVARRRNRQIYEVARFVSAEKVHDARRFLEGQTAQKEIVH